MSEVATELREIVDREIPRLNALADAAQNRLVTLDYFIRDYVAHQQHHLAQIPE